MNKMKNLLWIALLFMGLLACENDVDDDIDDTIETAFEVEYPEATKVRWTPDNTNGYYDVVFVDRGEELSARYDRTGKRVKTDRDNDRSNKTMTTTTTTTTSGSMNRNSTDYSTEVQTGLTKIGYRNDIPLLETEEADISAVPSSITAAVSRDYRGWTIHKVVRVEQDDRKVYKFELKSEELDKEVKPMYTAEGTLVGIDD